MRWAQGYPLESARARAVLVALAELCTDDEHRVAGRTQAEIAERSGQSIRTVSSYLAALEGAGAIRREVHPRVEGRGREPDLYVLAVDVLPADAPTTNRQPIGKNLPIGPRPLTMPLTFKI
ncbi:MAG: helix-turn-helix domain-containing protein [Actinomycetota bacterium]|nr:helix-turn-helix domain-containing protein [Actinomycetota bacterium]